MQWNYHSFIRKGIYRRNSSHRPWQRQWMRLNWPSWKERKRKQRKKKRLNSGTQHRHSTCAAPLICAAVVGWSAASWVNVSGCSNFSSRKCLKEFTAESTEVYTLPGEAEKGDGICSSILPRRVLDVLEEIWLQRGQPCPSGKASPDPSGDAIWSTHRGLFYGITLEKFFPLPLLEWWGCGLFFIIDAVPAF